MAKDSTHVVKEQQAIVDVIQRQAVELGVVEKAQLKFSKTMVNTPVIKQWLQIKRWTSGITEAFQAREEHTEGEEDAKEKAKSNLTVMQQLTVIMTQFGGAAKISAAGTSDLGKSLFRLVSGMLFITGIVLLVLLGFLALAAVLADVNSPLVEMLDNIPVVGEVFNGLRILLVGEDGESGLKGAFDVFILALFAGAIAWVFFGAPIAVLVIGIIMVIGIFRWAKGKTDSTVVALLAAGAVLMVALTVGSIFVKFIAFKTAAAFLLPVALILAGLALGWAVATGKVSAWWSILAAALVAIGAYFLMVAIGVGATFLLPVAIVIGVVVLIVVLVYRFRKQIGDFFSNAWTAAGDFFSGIATSIGNAWDDAITWLTTAIMDFIWLITWPSRTVFGLIMKIPTLWTKAQTKLEKIKIGITTWFAGIGMTIGTKWNSWMTKIKNIPADIARIVTSVGRAFANKWNDIMPLFTVKKWMTKIPGVPDSWEGKGILPDIPGFAAGGLVNSPTLGMIGEAGPEAVIPLKGGAVPVHMTGASGHTFNININPTGLIADSTRAKERFAKEISKEIMYIIERETVGTMKGSVKSVGSWF